MSRIIWFTALVTLPSFGPHPLVAADYHPCQGRVVPTSPREPREGTVNHAYGGVVTAVKKDSITIQWVNSPDEKPKSFAVSETLAAGKVPVEPRTLPGARYAPVVVPEYMYRLTDVKVGDCVGIYYARIDGIDICDHIRINRRPDGDVPPLQQEVEDLRDPRVAWRTQHPGKPLPEILARMPHQPYHEWINEYWAKIAPMPRAVKSAPKPTP